MDRLACWMFWVVCIFILHPFMIHGKIDPSDAISTNCQTLADVNINSKKNSISLSWTNRSAQLVSYYEIVYMYMQPCAAANIPAGVERFSGSLNQYTLNGLEEYSTYKLMHYIIYSEKSQDDALCTYIVNTSATAPVWPPSNLRVINTTNTTIVVGWGEVDCLHRNSEVTGYHIIYEQSSTLKLERNESKLIKSNIFMATDLIPGESYDFQVYSVNAEDVRGRTSTTLVVFTSFNDSLYPNNTSHTVPTTSLQETKTTSYSTYYPEELNRRLNAIVILTIMLAGLIITLVTVIVAAAIRKRFSPSLVGQLQPSRTWRRRKVSKTIETKSTDFKDEVEGVEAQHENTTQTKSPLPLPVYEGMAMNKNSAYSNKTQQGITASISGCVKEEDVSLYVSICPPQDHNKQDVALKKVSPYAISPVVVIPETTSAD